MVWSSVDLKAGLLHVKTGLIDVGKANGGRKLDAPKSASSRRTLSIPQELIHEMRIWKLKCPPSELDLVFCTLEGKPLHRKAASQILDEAIKAAGIKRLTPHKLRHSFASLLLSRGVRTKKVSQLLGHKDTIITQKVYEHFVDDKENNVQELASAILDKN
jgi:integrase